MGMTNETSFMRPVIGGNVNAEAPAPATAGRTTWVWEVELSDDDGKLCALTRVTVGGSGPGALGDAAG